MLSDALLASIREQVNTYCAEKQIPGFAFGIIHRGQLVETVTGGTLEIGAQRAPDSTSVFRIASMTKSFTAAGTLLLRDLGALRLDDLLVDILPWTSTIGVPDGSAPITIRDLLTMNAGFPTDDPWGDRQENLPLDHFDQLISRGISFTRAPRTGFEYSNLGYALLGRVISTVSGEPYEDFIRRTLLDRLHMSSTHFHYAQVPEAHRALGYAPVAAGLIPEPLVDTGAFSAMGGLHSSIQDLATWVDGFLSASAERTSDTSAREHPLARHSRLEMQEHQRLVTTTVTGDPAQSLTLSYGYGLMTETDSLLGRFVFHGGGYPGFGSFMKWHPASQWGVVVVGNRTYAPVYLLAVDVLNRIVKETYVSPHSATSLWQETLEAMAIAEQLLATWDNDLADSSFSINMDMDTPRAEREESVRTISHEVGHFTRSTEGWLSRSPAHVQWTVTGSARSARMEVLMSPERPTKIQSLKISLLESGAD